MILKKSQVALEFLMTYGWAILVVLVAIGALAYFGVLSPDKFLPSKCTLQAGIACIDHRTQSSQVQVVLRNALGYDISSVIVRAEGCGSSSSFSLANGAQTNPPVAITCATPLTGTKYSGALNVSYTITDTGLDHTNQGSIISKIE